MVLQDVEHRPPARISDTERLCNAGRDQFWKGNGRELDHEHAIGKLRHHRFSYRVCETRLSSAADPGHCQKSDPVVAKHLCDVGHLTSTTDDRCVIAPQI